MTRGLRRKPVTLGLLVLAGACVPLPPLPDEPASHPASADAAEAPIPPRSLTLDRAPADPPAQHGPAPREGGHR